jgi:hypothetical protein
MNRQPTRHHPCVGPLVTLLFGNLLLTAANAENTKIEVPKIPGLTVRVGKEVKIPGATNSIAHQFEDGRIVVVGEDGKGVWSSDGGRTWKEGPAGPDDKTTFNLGGSEILSIARTSVKRDDGKFNIYQRRSPDNWKTVIKEDAIIDSPLASSTGGDTGEHHDGLLVHHGAVRLKNGDLMISTYGNYQGDTELADGYPEEFKMLKYRTVVLFSKDNGKTWANPITVAYDKQLGRGTDDDSSVQTTTIVPAQTQEGFCESDLVTAADGSIICAMRSGGRIGVKKAPSFPTPLFISRSTDEGQTWSPPVPVADRGVCPYLVKLENDVIVCSYARPGDWLIFSDDNGESWKGSFEFGPGGGYNTIFEVAPNKFIVIYHRDSSYVAQHFSVERE